MLSQHLALSFPIFRFFQGHVAMRCKIRNNISMRFGDFARYPVYAWASAKYLSQRFGQKKSTVSKTYMHKLYESDAASDISTIPTEGLDAGASQCWRRMRASWCRAGRFEWRSARRAWHSTRMDCRPSTTRWDPEWNRSFRSSCGHIAPEHEDRPNLDWGWWPRYIGRTDRCVQTVCCHRHEFFAWTN